MAFKTTQLKNILDFSLDLAEKVSKQLLRDQKHLADLKITHKQAQGVVSEADLRAEEKIIGALKKKFPDHSFLAEETSYLEHGESKKHYAEMAKKEWLWIIDPLDGTNNYLNGLDYYAISMALCHRGKVVLALVYRPSTTEVFYALESKGAFYRSPEAKRFKKLYLERTTKKLSECLLSTGFVSEKAGFFAQEFEVFKTLMLKGRGIRRMGSAVLDLCYVALGKFDGFWERGLAPWDTAAAGYICQLSGVKVTEYSGRPFDPFSPTIVAARKPLHVNLKKELPQQAG